MLFNSLQFAVFFIIVYVLYLALNHKWQNRMLLVASYIFYGAWDWRFLILLWISTAIDYFCGIKIYDAQDTKKRKLFLALSVLGNLSILGFFKYFNFFAANLQALLNFFGFHLQPRFLHIVLPVGISFYTFQAMSYTIDIYRNRLKPARKFSDLALFIVFFPQLVAGPIERASHLLPQVLSPRRLSWDKFYEGCYLICWGLFMKVFIADNLAKIVDPVFTALPPYNGAMVLLALYAFAFQIFCDFAGYSHIARGLGKCMGFDIMVNFNLPYFATNPREFWQRWHISLSSWLRDYLYIPLGGNKKGGFLTYRNLAITMLLGGLWHGAAWTFFIWGAYQGTLLVAHRLLEPVLKDIPQPRSIFASRVWFMLRVFFFFNLVCLGWLLFRANSLGQAWQMLRDIVINFHIADAGLYLALRMFIGCTWFLVIIQIFQFIKKDLLVVFKWHWALQGVVYFMIIFILTTFGVDSAREFIYFQF